MYKQILLCYFVGSLCNAKKKIMQLLEENQQNRKRNMKRMQKMIGG